MYSETVLLISLIVAYYVAHGRKFLSLERVAEPSFIVNVLYLLNFPVRALVRMLLGDALDSAPALVWDVDTANAALLYSAACMLVFNFSYEYFRRRGSLLVAPAVRSLQPLQRIPRQMMSYFVLLGLIVVYFTLTSKTNTTFVSDIEGSDIPQVIYAIQIAFDAAILGSLVMYLHTRRFVYLAAFALFFGIVIYEAFLLTAKYAVFGYLIVSLLVMKRFGLAIRFRHLVLFGLIVVPFTITSYTVRGFDLMAISSDATLASRLELLGSLLPKSNLWDSFVDLFLLKMTDRFVYLESFMLYQHEINHGIALDLYDMLGSLPTYKIAIPSIFGVDKSTVQNIHVWYANKYWYGTPPDTWSVVIPFGRMVESFMIFGWLGSLFFVFYGWLFALLYSKLFCSTNPLLVIYYCFLFYNYIMVDDVLLFNVSAILYGTIFLFGSIWVFKRLRLRRVAM